MQIGSDSKIKQSDCERDFQSPKNSIIRFPCRELYWFFFDCPELEKSPSQAKCFILESASLLRVKPWENHVTRLLIMRILQQVQVNILRKFISWPRRVGSNQNFMVKVPWDPTRHPIVHETLITGPKSKTTYAKTINSQFKSVKTIVESILTVWSFLTFFWSMNLWLLSLVMVKCAK